MSDTTLQSYRVWDLPTRWFHWINLVCVVALAALGTALLFDDELGVTDAGKLFLKTTHVWFGYIFALNLAWRFVWGFVGNRHARWSAIHPFRAGYVTAFTSYLREFSAGNVRPYLGHNPAARAAVTILYILLFVQAVTGLILAGTDIYYPPFGHWIASWIAAPGIDPLTIVPYSKTGIDQASWDAMRYFRSFVVPIHYWNFYALIVAIVVHVVGVVVTEQREGGAIVSAMVTGKKHFHRPPVDDWERDA